MSSQTTATTTITTDNFGEERSSFIVRSDKNGDFGSVSSSADSYQHFSSKLTRYKITPFVVFHFIKAFDFISKIFT